MLESAVVQISLDDFNILNEDSNQYRLLKKLLGSCCTVDVSEYENSHNPEDVRVEVNANKMADMLKKYASIDFDANENESLKKDGIMFAKVEFKK